MITGQIFEWARSQPAKQALIADDQTLSYAEFARAIDAARGFFLRYELPVGQTAIVFPGSLIDAWVFSLGFRALGIDTVCVQKVRYAEALKLKNVACVVIGEGQRDAIKLNGTAFEAITTITVPSSVFSRIRLDDPLPPPANLEAGPPFGGHILLTSGTTGAYKKVLMEGRYEEKRNTTWSKICPLSNATMCHVHNLGPWTGVGFKVPSAVWHAGGCVVMDTSSDALANFFRYPVDFSIIGPSALREVVQSAQGGVRHDNCELLVASGFLPTELAADAVRLVTTKLGILYSSTELAAPPLISRRGAESDMHWLTPMADRVVQIVDEEENKCPPGKEGELRIELMDFDCSSYIEDDEASAKMFRQGFFSPGDIAVGHADGRIRVLGRTADVLNILGHKVAVAPLELEIERWLGVEEVCLFSGVDAAGKEELVVVVQSDRMPPKTALDQIGRKFPAFPRFRVEVFTRTAADEHRHRKGSAVRAEKNDLFRTDRSRAWAASGGFVNGRVSSCRAR